MLKIKDNVDLKELEKFGFEEDRFGDYVKKLPVKEHFKFKTSYANIMIDRTEKIGRIGFVIDNIYCLDIELDTLYDLIQAGLVEKVSE